MTRNAKPGDPDTDVVAGVATTRVRLNSENKPICGAPKRGGGECQMGAGYGTDHPGFGTCKFHGGTMPSNSVGAARQEALDYVDKMKQLGIVGPEVSPDEALMQEVARAQAAVEFFDGEVKRLTEDEDVDTSSARFTKIVWHWNEQRRILTTVSSLVVKAGLAKRHVEIQEMQAAAVLTAVLGVISSPELSLEPEQIDFAKRRIAMDLRNLAMGQEQREVMEAAARG